MAVTLATTVYNAGASLFSGTLTSGSPQTIDVDFSGKVKPVLMFKNLPGGSVSATRGVRLDIYRRYGSGPSVQPSTEQVFTLPSLVAATAESKPPIHLGPWLYRLVLTQLDATFTTTVDLDWTAIDSIRSQPE